MTDTRRFAQAVEITTATYDKVARNYAERNGYMLPHWLERLEQFVDLLGEELEKHPIPSFAVSGDELTLSEYLNFAPVLDAGCGPGRDARELASHNLPVLGVDLSEGMLDEASERTARRLPRGAIRYALMDLRRLELPDRCCRGVWCSASLLHLPRQVAPRAVAELARVARSDAPVVILLKRAGDGDLEQFQAYLYGEFGEEQRFFAFYTPDEARQLVENAGLDIIDVEIVSHSDPSKPDWISLLARKIG
jgi:SAM-dependent methyltransferase